MKKGTKLYSILKVKCPYCQEGEFMESRNFYNFRKIGNVNESCSSCHKKLEPEPGFYFGAMYVAYGMGVAIFVACWVACNVLLGGWRSNAEWVILAVAVAMLVFGPLVYGYSKIIWANMFMKYTSTPPVEK